MLLHKKDNYNKKIIAIFYLQFFSTNFLNIERNLEDISVQNKRLIEEPAAVPHMWDLRVEPLHLIIKSVYKNTDPNVT